VEAGFFGGGGVASGVAKETTREAVFLSRPVIIMLITLIYRQINSWPVHVIYLYIGLIDTPAYKLLDTML
jgi:hypothetical protein